MRQKRTLAEPPHGKSNNPHEKQDLTNGPHEIDETNGPVFSTSYMRKVEGHIMSAD